MIMFFSVFFNIKLFYFIKKLTFLAYYLFIIYTYKLPINVKTNKIREKAKNEDRLMQMLNPV